MRARRYTVLSITKTNIPHLDEVGQYTYTISQPIKVARRKDTGRILLELRGLIQPQMTVD